MMFTYDVWSWVTSLTFTRTESTTLLRKTHRRCDLFLTNRINPRVWFPSRASVACIIDMIGSGLPKHPS